jgi:hypothetical protein
VLTIIYPYYIREEPAGEQFLCGSRREVQGEKKEGMSYARRYEKRN